MTNNLKKGKGSYIGQNEENSGNMDNRLAEFPFLSSPPEVCITIAENVRKKRKAKRMTIKELSLRSAIPYSTLKRFEHTGKISLFSLVKIAFVLDCENDFKELFTKQEIRSIEDIIRGNV